MLKRIALAASLFASLLSPALAAPAVIHAFEISDAAGHGSLLIPSLHVPAPGIVQPSPQVLQGARVLLVEHGDVSAASDPGAGGDQEAAWAESLTEHERQAYETRARCAGVSAEKAEEALHRVAVQVANQIAYTSCTTEGRPSRDDILRRAAIAQHVRVMAMEDSVWVEGQRRKVPASSQAQAFRWILDHDVDDVLHGVVEAFNAGDFEAVAHLTEQSWGSHESFVSSYEPMVVERNARWLQDLPRVLGKGGAVIDVGALHIPGPMGLVQQLRERGYKVVPVTRPGAL